MVIKARRSDVVMYLHIDFDSVLEKCFFSSSSPHIFTDVCVSSPHIQVHLNKLECCGKVHLFQ